MTEKQQTVWGYGDISLFIEWNSATDTVHAAPVKQFRSNEIYIDRFRTKHSYHNKNDPLQNLKIAKSSNKFEQIVKS